MIGKTNQKTMLFEDMNVLVEILKTRVFVNLKTRVSGFNEDARHWIVYIGERKGTE
jgi:hypothetical protein